MYWVTRSWDSCDVATRAGDRDSAAVVTKPVDFRFMVSSSYLLEKNSASPTLSRLSEW